MSSNFQTNTSVYLRREERALIERAAKKLRLKRTAFMRDAMLEVAKRVLKIKVAEDQVIGFMES